MNWRPGEVGEFHRIAIVRLSSFGDVVMAMPALAGLRATYPKAHIAWIVESRARNVLEAHPAIDEIIEFPRSRWRSLWKQRFGVIRSVPEVRRFYRSLRDRRFDLAIDFQGNMKSGTCTWATRAPVRIGYARDECREWNTLFTNHHWSPGGQPLHRMDRDRLLVGQVGVPFAPCPILPAYSPADRAASRDLKIAGDTRPIVILHPGTSDFMPHKRWPQEAWIQLGDGLVRRSGARVLLSWGPGEEATARSVQRGMTETAELLPDTPSVKSLGAALTLADLVVGGDTGPVHLAVLQGIATVALLGPGDPRHYYPYGHADRAFYRRTACSPCRFRACPSLDCMRGIEVAPVLEKCVQILHRGTGSVT